MISKTLVFKFPALPAQHVGFIYSFLGVRNCHMGMKNGGKWAFLNAFSFQSLYDAFFITCYNLFFTSLPVLAVGILDQDVDDKNSVKYAPITIIMPE